MSEPDLLDEPLPAPAPSRWKRRLGCFGVPLLLFTACGGFYGYLIYRTNEDTRQAVAETDRLEPDGWDIDTIEAHRLNPPDAENAALVVQALKSKLPAPWPPPRPLPPPPAAAGGGAVGEGVPAPPPGSADYVENDLGDLPPPVQPDAALLRDLRAALQAAAKALPEADRLKALRDGHFPIQYAPDSMSTKINSQDARDAAELLALEAALYAQEGRPDEAIRAVRGAVVAARSVGDEPFLISQLVRLACDALAVRALERVLAQGQPSEEALKGLQELLTAEEAAPHLLYAARGERAGMHRLLTALESGEVKLSAVGPGGPSGADLAGPTLARRSHARMLRLLNDFVEAAKLPPEEQAEPIKEIDRKTRQAKVEYDVMTGLFMPAIIKVGEASRRVKAELRCAVTAVAAERYRRDHGAWPKALGDLAPKYLPAVPADPFDGKPLRLARRDDGITVYSVGPDGQDDGGAINRTHPLAKGTDLGFRLWDVDRRRQPAAKLLPKPDEAPGP